MTRCYITDAATLVPRDTILAAIERNLARGVEWIQIREKQRDARGLFQLVQQAMKLPNPHGTRFIVNSRVDVALAAGTCGAHLPAGSSPPHSWRSIVPQGFLFGVSCHSVGDVQRAEEAGADYVVFGPVFAPVSKNSLLSPRGLDELAEAAAVVRIPVLALGGVTQSNTAACLAAGAAGVAGISLFQSL